MCRALGSVLNTSARERAHTHTLDFVLTGVSDSFYVLVSDTEVIDLCKGPFVFPFLSDILFMTSCFSIKSHLIEQQMLFTYGGSSALPYICSSGGP